MNATPTLVVLAAGLGSRYGDAKQIAGVGPHGEWLLEYALHDALAAGFGKIILVIRPELRAPLREHIGPVLQGRAQLEFVVQSTDDVPIGCTPPRGRSKPLGTGHALWCCRALLDGPFAVINADDYYGEHAFALLAAHFACSTEPAMVGYRLDATLSEQGGVNRGVCEVDAHGCLRGVTEIIGIARDADGALRGTAPDGTQHTLADDSIVSLNCWGLHPALLPDLEAGLVAFLQHADARSEYFLPATIDRHVAAHGLALHVLPTPDSWLGLTYPGDRPHVEAALATLHAGGVYPPSLRPAP